MASGGSTGGSEKTGRGDLGMKRIVSLDTLIFLVVVAGIGFLIWRFGQPVQLWGCYQSCRESRCEIDPDECSSFYTKQCTQSCLDLANQRVKGIFPK